jgi:hypothetical protein
MGVYMFTGVCCACGKTFSFHPNKVPSLNVNGVRQPICKDCVDHANPLRIKQGQPPITYSKDAYKTSLDEEDDHIDWQE